MAGRRLEIGFHGGNVLRATLEDAQVTALTDALAGDAAWYQLDADEGRYWLKVSDLQFVRIPDDGPHGVGFSRA
jgi:hypothetical protein